MSFPKTTAFLVECRTGCSCCANENHIRGPFSTLALAETAIAKYREVKLLASQYSKFGNYSLQEASCEVLPDGRLIIAGDRVVEGFVDGYDPTEGAAVYEHTGY